MPGEEEDGRSSFRALDRRSDCRDDRPFAIFMVLLLLLVDGDCCGGVAIVNVVRGRRDFAPVPLVFVVPPELPGQFASVAELFIEMRLVARDVVGVEIGFKLEEDDVVVVVAVDDDEIVVMGVELRESSRIFLSRSRSRSRGVVRYWR